MLREQYIMALVVIPFKFKFTSKSNINNTKRNGVFETILGLLAAVVLSRILCTYKVVELHESDDRPGWFRGEKNKGNRKQDLEKLLSMVSLVTAVGTLAVIAQSHVA